MKAILAGLIPSTPCRAFIGQIILAGVCLLPFEARSAVDDWPAYLSAAPYDPIEESYENRSAMAMACISSLNVSLDQTGHATLTPGMLLLSHQYPLNMYVVDIMGPLNDVVSCNEIGQSLMVSVREIPTGNICMSTVNVEDKLRPVIICSNDTIPCSSDLQTLDYLSFLDYVYDNCDDDPAVFYQYTITDLNCDPNGMAGFVDITYTATDNYGNTNSCAQRIYLRKYTLEEVAFPADTMINCDGAVTDPEVTGQPTIGGLPITHFCELISWKTDNVINMCSGQQKIMRLWRVMDWCTGITISDVQEIKVIDTVPPVLICPPNLTLGTSMLVCSAPYTLPQPNATDVCSNDALISFRYSISTIPGIFLPGANVSLVPGPHLVTIFATDDCNNTATCQYTITVVDDDPPVVVCNHLNITLGPDGMAFLNANSPAFNATDNCGVVLREVWRMTDNCNTPANLIPGPQVKFCCEDLGAPVMVLFQATDAAGNASTCMIQVTIKDAEAPTALCKDACIFLGPGGTVTLPVDSIDNGSFDNCTIVNRQLSKTTFDCSDIGYQVVILTVTDQSGNSATCSANVEVKDTIPPVALCRDITVELNAMGMLTISTGMINNGSSDNCAIDTMFLTRYDFDCSDIGENTVMLIVIDIGGLSDTCTATVTVEDMPPMVECMDVTVYLDENGEVTITPDDVDGVYDDCSVPDREVNPDSFNCEDVGPNIVVLLATDDSGNTATCSAVVTVLDTIPPVCVAMDITIELDADGSVTLPGNALDDGSTDNCTIVSITITPNTFTCAHTSAPVVVIQTVTDASGNTSTCSAIVTVEDNLDPECLTQNIVVQLNAAGMATILHTAVNNGSNDNCGIASIVLDQTQFDCGDVGVVIVTQTVTDVNGNTSTCTALVTVEDNIAPTCLTQDITIQLDEDGNASIENTAVDNGSSDACGVLSITVNPSTFDCDDIGVVVVVQTVTDINGNTSTCTASVTVQDDIAPVCLTQDITVTLGPDGTVTIDGDAVDDGSFDNCGILSITVDPNTFDCGSPDVVVVIQTVTDVNGNTSTCSANVTVMGGEEPVAQCQDVTVYLDQNGDAFVLPEDVDNGSFSVCGDIELEVNPAEFDCEMVGGNTVTLTVTDVTGNSATCTATVTVFDTLPPVCLTQDITVYVDENGMVSITVDDVDTGTFDNCGIDTITITPSDFTCADIGPNVITKTAIDVNGNVGVDHPVVTVLDTLPPVCIAQDITVVLDGTGNISITPGQIDNGSSDNCGAVMLSVTPSAFTCDDVGENIVTLTVTDGSGNTSTCTAIVTVEDPGGLVALCQNITVFLDANGMVVVNPSQIDNGSGGGCSAGNLMFSLNMTNFNCTHIGPNMVILTVTDNMGNSATCTAIVTVLDNLPPTIICPPNMTADCDDPINLNNLSMFGNPITMDNCISVTVMESVQDNRNDCGAGTIVRTFLATDGSGNTAQCMQVITVGDADPFDAGDIIWPPAIVNLGQCSSTDPGPGNQPIINAGSCSVISVNYQDMTVMTVDNDPLTPCIVITRMWTVIDSCQLVPGTMNGIFTFTQMIILNDNVGPIFAPINNVTVTADPVTCEAFVMLIASATDCGIAMPVTNDYTMGGGNASAFYPIGVTTVTFTSMDPCGNISTRLVTVTVLDPNPATVMCHKIIRHMGPELDITVIAREFVDIDPGACSNPNAFLISYSPTNPFDSVRVFGCQFAGSVEPVQIYTFDPNGVPIDTCRGDLDLRDSLDFCGQSLTITGEIFGENFAMITSVPVLISDPGMDAVTTGPGGRYTYIDLLPGGRYDIRPEWNANPKYGISTLDLIAIQKHLLGIKQLDSPYKYIAADVNNSGGVSILDLIEVRRLLLDQIAEFPNNMSWRFVEAGYVFPDPVNPWMHAYPENVCFDSLDGHKTRVNFVGVKIGDVNNTVFQFQSEDVDVRSAQALTLSTQDIWLSPGQVYDVPIMVERYDHLLGYQFALRIDPTFADITGISLPADSHLDVDWFGIGKKGEGVISTLWHESVPRSIGAGETMFSVQIRARTPVQLSQILEFEDKVLRAEGYMAEGETKPVPVRLVFGTIREEGDFAVFQNVPNPFREGTLLPAQLPDDGLVTLEIFSSDGRLVFRQHQAVTAGYHEFTVHAMDLGNPGMYYYTISTDRYRATRKLILTE